MDFARKAAAASTKSLLMSPPLRRLPANGPGWMYCRSCVASHLSAPIRPRFPKRIPDAVFGPAPEAHIDRVPLAITLVHVAPRAADPQHMQHPIEMPRDADGYPVQAAPSARAPREEAARSPPIPRPTNQHEPRMPPEKRSWLAVICRMMDGQLLRDFCLLSADAGRALRKTIGGFSMA